MTHERQEDSTAVVLGRDGLRAGWIWVGVTTALGAVLITVSLAVEVYVLAVYGAGALLLAATTVYVLLQRTPRGRAVVDDAGITIRHRHGEYHCAWPEVIEVGAGSLGGSVPTLYPWCQLAVRPEGSRWATPGPNAPFTVPLPIFGRAAHRRAQTHLRAVCERHGVPFTTDVMRMQEQPRPGSVLRARAPDDAGDGVSRG